MLVLRLASVFFYTQVKTEYIALAPCFLFFDKQFLPRPS